MIKRYFWAFMLFTAAQVMAQQGTASPYSFYGIGSLKFKGTVENRSMGGISFYSDSIHINLRNPASYASPNLSVFGNASRPVKYTVGGSHSMVSLETQNINEKTATTTMDYLALSLPIGKFGIGFGLLPYTSVGYKLESFNDTDEIQNRYRGEGGVNKAFFSVGYLINDQFSIGVDAQYNFGNIQNSSIGFLYDSEGNIIQYQSREENRSDLSGLNFNFGLSYKTKLTEKLELISGLTFAPEYNLVSRNQRSFSTIVINAATGQDFPIDTIDEVLNPEDRVTDLTIPMKYALGAGLGQPRKWFVGAEYESQQTSRFSNDFLSASGVVYEDSYRMSLGGFFIPNFRSATSYWKRVVYRAGVHYEQTGLNIENQSIDEFGISFGLGLPVGRLFSNANLGLEMGRRGTTANNLIQENFVNLQISLSLNDKWFEKRKYD